jgi:hypothetical protein
MVKIKKEDLPEAMQIVMAHERDFDKISRRASTDSNGNSVITFSFSPYLYSDLEHIKHEFKLAGIQIL